MPIYEYQCSECGHLLEALQKISEDPLTLCPACDKPALKKRVSAAAFRLKGGGWYETDFKTDKQKNVAKSDDKPADKKAEKKADKSNKDAKPAGGGTTTTQKKDS